MGASISTLLLAGGCVEPVGTDLSGCPPGQVCAAVGGAGGSIGSGGSGVGTGGLLASGGAGSGTGGSHLTSGGAGGAPSSGGVNNGSGGQTIGSGGGSGGEPCVDAPAPYDETWPEATCDSWANEAFACSEPWFAEYCDITCGRCIPEDTGSGGAAAVDCSTNTELPDVSGGDGFATRYWDCCQPHCAQNGGHKCNKDGTSVTGNNSSACSVGDAGSFACYDDAPYAVSDCLAYGHVAKANPNCGGCYRIEFTGQGYHNANDAGSKLIKGKQMIVKVSNTGSDVAGNQFDLMIPGGGVGIHNACSNQWNVSNDQLGEQYGGFLSDCTGTLDAKKQCVRDKCNLIPAGAARDGCNWFVDWFHVADNPKFTSQPTECPF